MSGQKSVKSSVLKNGKINIYFSSTVCGACSFFQDCVNANRKTKLTKRGLTVGPDHAFIQERRIEQKTDNFKKEMRVSCLTTLVGGRVEVQRAQP